MPPTPDALLDLLETRGLHAGEAIQQLQALEPEAVRAALMPRLVRGEVEGLDTFGLLDRVLEHAGVGDEAQQVASMVLDTTRTRTLRASLAHQLSAEARSEWESLLEGDELPDGDETLPMEASVRRRLMYLSFDAEPEGLLAYFEGVDAEFAELISPKIEALRQGQRIDAVIAYRAALERPELSAFHPWMLDAVAAEATPAGVELLERLREQADGDQRAALHRAVVKARTRLIDPDAASVAPLPDGEAWISTTDPDGTIGVLARFPRPDGAEDVITLMLNLTGVLPTGGLMARQPPSVLAELLEQFTGAGVIGVVSATPAQAGQVVQRVLDFTGLDALPAEARSGVELLLRCARAETPSALPEPHPSPTIEALYALLQRKYYRVWALPPAIAEAFRRNKEGLPLDDIADELSVALSVLHAATDHMARWHALEGDAEAASLMGAVASSDKLLGILMALLTPR